MNRFGKNIAVFLSKMAMRLVGLPREVVPPVEAPKPVRKVAVQHRGRQLAVAGLACAVVFLVSSKEARTRIVSLLRATKSATKGATSAMDSIADAVSAE